MEVNQKNDMDSLTAEAKWFSAAPTKHVKRSGSDGMRIGKRKFITRTSNVNYVGKKEAAVMMSVEGFNAQILEFIGDNQVHVN